MEVLICDDEPDIRALYRTAFEGRGAHVVIAADGDECLREAAVSHPDLIVLDLAMPGRSGFATLPELHQLVPEAAVVVVSAYSTLDNFSRARDLGADECFDKLDFLGRIPSVIARFGPAA